MSPPPVFKDGTFTQEGVTFPLTSNIYLLERIGELSAQQMRVLAEANGLPWHPGIPRRDIDFAVGSVLQRQWYEQTTGEVSAKIAQCEITYTTRYREMIDKLNKGESIMATKEKKPKAAKKEKAPKQVLTYELDATKARAYEDGIYVKESEAAAYDSYAGHIVRALLAAPGKKLTFPELSEEVAKTAKKAKTSRKHMDSIYATCRKLEKEAKVMKRSKQPVAESKAA